MKLREWIPTLIMGPIALFGIVYLFQLRADRQSDLEHALCRQDVNALREEILDHFNATGALPETVEEIDWHPGPVLAEVWMVLTEGGEDFEAHGVCVIDGEEVHYRATIAPVEARQL